MQVSELAATRQIIRPWILSNRDRISPQHALLSQYITSFCKKKHLYFEHRNEKVSPESETLGPCGFPILSLLDHLSSSLINGFDSGEAEDAYDLVLKRLDNLIEIATEKFYAFPFKDVPPCWRELFREASFIKVAALAVNGGPGRSRAWDHTSLGSRICHNITDGLEEPMLSEMVKTIDMALIMAGQPTETSTRATIDGVLDLLQELYSDPPKAADVEPPLKRVKITRAPSKIELGRFHKKSAFTPPVSNYVPRITEPSFDFIAFEAYMKKPRNTDLGPEPIVIGSAIESWPARNERPWKSPSYLLSKTIGGRRLVPIETGRSYVDEGWGQKIVTFREFIEHNILLDPQTPDLPSGYLAQHDLFAQIPALRNDISIPDYCYTSPPPPHHSSPLAARHAQMPRLKDPLLNAWFGPAGTISPLHTDPYHNILTQVVGNKYVRLYAPRESEKLYARGVEYGGVDMGNTSALDIGILARWDGTKEEQVKSHEKFPLFIGAEFVDCILEEGDCLYIPVGWWHYVRSLSVSFSVSFWFN